MTGVNTQNRWLFILLLFFLCIAATSYATTPEQRLEQIKLDSKSRPREVNITIDAWLTELPAPSLAIREHLITTKAFNLMVLSDYDSAQQLLDSWLQEVQATEPAKTTRAIEISGYIAMRRGDHSKATTLLQQAVALATRFNQPERQITTRIYSAMHAMQMGQYQTALELFAAAEKLNQQYQFGYLKVNIQNNLSYLYIQLGDYQKALTLLTAALTDPTYLPADLIYVRMNLARCYVELKRYSEAEPHARLALQGYQQREDPFYQSVVYLLLTEIAFHQHRLLDAGNALQPALMLAEKHQLNQQLSDGYLLKSQILQQQAKPEAALTALQQHLTYYKKYHNAEAQQQLLQLRNQIDTLRQQQQIAELEQKIELNSLEEKHQKRAIWISVTAAIAVVLLLLFLIRQQQNKRQQAEHYSNELALSYQQLQQTQRHLIASEKMAAIAGMVAGLAHELNTPLGILTTAVSLLQEKTAEFHQKLQSGLTRQDLQLYLTTADDVHQLSAHNVERCARLVQNFKQLAVQRSDEITTFHLRQLIADILPLLDSRFHEQKVLIRYEQTDLWLHADIQHFQLLLLELLTNAVLHAFIGRTQGEIELSICLTTEHWELHYRDDGVGFTSAAPDKVFEPFYTTSRHSGHAGLGLNLVYNLVTVALEGEIEAVQVSTGFALCCRLPRQLLAQS
jgi:C4-dicarboxylate-specific signal transduction histidine kinase